MASGIRLSRDVVATAKALGHTSAQLVPVRGQRVAVVCSCGYRSAGRQTDALAFEALAHHLAKVTAGRVINGVSVPRVGA